MVGVWVVQVRDRKAKDREERINFQIQRRNINTTLLYVSRMEVDLLWPFVVAFLAKG